MGFTSFHVFLLAFMLFLVALWFVQDVSSIRLEQIRALVKFYMLLTQQIECTMYHRLAVWRP